MSNRKKQDEAIKAIHKIANLSNMMVFMLVDEDLDTIDGTEDLSQDEKDEIWETMHDQLLEVYHERLEMVVEEVISNR